MTVGYVNGTFDMFHVGHLRLIQRAREMCDKLIIGVNRDEDIIINKGRPAVISETSRLEIIRALKACDEAFLAPTYYLTVEQMIKMGADVNFMGSDYADHPVINQLNKDLEPHGKRVIILSRTDGISTSIIREILNG